MMMHDLLLQEISSRPHITHRRTDESNSLCGDAAPARRAVRLVVLHMILSNDVGPNDCLMRCRTALVNNHDGYD
jgi:hypothetical protein